MAHVNIAKHIQGAISSIQLGDSQAALAQVDQAMAEIEALLIPASGDVAVATRDSNGHAGPAVSPALLAKQRQLLRELHAYLILARDAVESRERYTLASTQLSFALCQLQLTDA
jgi:hypothetical protein